MMNTDERLRTLEERVRELEYGDSSLGVSRFLFNSDTFYSEDEKEACKRKALDRLTSEEKDFLSHRDCCPKHDQAHRKLLSIASDMAWLDRLKEKKLPDLRKQDPAKEAGFDKLQPCCKEAFVSGWLAEIQEYEQEAAKLEA